MLHEIVQQSLATHDVKHETMSCDPELADTAAFCEAYGIDPSDSANTILVASKRPAGRVAACLVLATHRLDVNHAVRAEMDVKKLSFASPELTMELTSMQVGGVTVFGLPPDMPVLVDSAVMDRQSIVLGGGNRNSKLKITPASLQALPTVRVVEGLARPILV